MREILITSYTLYHNQIVYKKQSQAWYYCRVQVTNLGKPDSFPPTRQPGAQVGSSQLTPEFEASCLAWLYKIYNRVKRNNRKRS